MRKSIYERFLASEPKEEDSNAMLTFEEGRYYIALWYVAIPNCSDWLAGVWRDIKGGWECRARTRTYLDKKIHDSDDRKIFEAHHFPADKSEADVEEQMDRLALDIANMAEVQVTKIPLHTDDETKIAEIISKYKFMHLRPGSQWARNSTLKN